MLKQLSKKEDYKVGRIFSHQTCDAIDLNLNGKTKEINPHIEYLIITKVGQDNIYYENMRDGSKGKTKKSFACYLFKLEPSM